MYPSRPLSPPLSLSPFLFRSLSLSLALSRGQGPNLSGVHHLPEPPQPLPSIFSPSLSLPMYLPVSVSLCVLPPLSPSLPLPLVLARSRSCWLALSVGGRIRPARRASCPRARGAPATRCISYANT